MAAARKTADSIARDPRRLLAALALLLGLGELGDAFFVSFPPGPAVFGALLLVGAFWIRRGGIGGPAFVAALFVFEIANAPFWPRTSVADWITSIAYPGVALTGLVVALAVIQRFFGARKATTTAARLEA
ncbi:MAG TPA: hypothetical protein VK488_02030 [Gaiellaceae bacterium]|nr:hypothetical protein [Gaiellaceae bacterium]